MPGESDLGPIVFVSRITGFAAAMALLGLPNALFRDRVSIAHMLSPLSTGRHGSTRI